MGDAAASPAVGDGKLSAVGLAQPGREREQRLFLIVVWLSCTRTAGDGGRTCPRDLAVSALNVDFQ